MIKISPTTTNRCRITHLHQNKHVNFDFLSIHESQPVWSSPWLISINCFNSILWIKSCINTVFQRCQHPPTHRLVLPFSIYHKLKAAALMEEQEPQKQQQQTPHVSRPVGSNTHIKNTTHNTGSRSVLLRGDTQPSWKQKVKIHWTDWLLAPVNICCVSCNPEARRKLWNLTCRVGWVNRTDLTRSD